MMVTSTTVYSVAQRRASNGHDSVQDYRIFSFHWFIDLLICLLFKTQLHILSILMPYQKTQAA
jgi:hypothetical protein